MRFKLSICLLLGCLLGCVETDMEEDVRQTEWWEEVHDILKGDLIEPEGKLHKELFYGNKNNASLVAYGKYYYNSQGTLVLRIGFSARGDTISVRIPTYNASGRETERNAYNHPSSVTPGSEREPGGTIREFEWSSTHFFQYDDVGRRTSVESANSRRDRQLVWTHSYNDLGLVEETLYFQRGEEVIERHVYEYDEKERMVKENWFFDQTSDNPYREYFLRYNESGLLEAKSTELIMPIGEMGDVFVYEYDEKDRLIEEREYGINWGLPLMNRKRYEYY